jgi:hypothetical protein
VSRAKRQAKQAKHAKQAKRKRERRHAAIGVTTDTPNLDLARQWIAQLRENLVIPEPPLVEPEPENTGLPRWTPPPPPWAPSHRQEST